MTCKHSGPARREPQPRVHTPTFLSIAPQTSTGSFRADAAVVTVPLGVLKRSALTFSPSLPKDKQAAIHRLGYGVLNKCVLLFPFVFWDDTIDTFGHVDTSDDPSDRGLFYLFYQYSGLSGGALLGALVAGEGAAGRGISMSTQVRGRVNALTES